MRSERRRHKRRRLVLPVRVSLANADGLTAGAQFVHTIDITEAGARVGGLRTGIESGQIITLQRGPHKARFRVIWTKQLDPSEIHAGIECTEPDKNVWGCDLDIEDQAATGKDQELLMKILLRK